MSFDGIRPSQVNPYADPLHPQIGAYAAAEHLKKTPRVQSAKNSRNSEGVQKKLQQYAQNEEKDHSEQSLSEEELQEVLLFAKLRGILHNAVDAGEVYMFVLNEETGMIDLVNQKTGVLALTLTPDELFQMSDKLHRYAGMLTDRSA